MNVFDLELFNAYCSLKGANLMFEISKEMDECDHARLTVQQGSLVKSDPINKQDFQVTSFNRACEVG